MWDVGTSVPGSRHGRLQHCRGRLLGSWSVSSVVSAHIGLDVVGIFWLVSNGSFILPTERLTKKAAMNVVKVRCEGSRERGMQ